MPVHAQLVVAVILAVTGSLFAADALPRRASIGALTVPPDSAAMAATGQTFEGGAVIYSTFPGGTAAAAELQPGDILLSLDDNPVAGPQMLAPWAKSRRPGSRIRIEFIRGAVRRTQRVTLREFPREHTEDYDVRYESLPVDGALRRIILTLPRTDGPHPLFVLLGDIGCYSVDPPLGMRAPYLEIVQAMTRAGFATLRIEKSGMGDSQGQPCMEQGFWHEVRGYSEAIKASRRDPRMDSSRVILFGHGFGGIAAPIIAGEVPVAGIVAFGTMVTEWTEYELGNLRRQRWLAGLSGDSVETEGQLKTRVMQRLLWEDKTPEQITAEFPNAEAILGYPCHHSYIAELGRINKAGFWQRFRGKSLFISGSADFISPPEESRFAYDIVNRAHPRHAQVVELDSLDHFLIRSPNPQAAFDNMAAGLPNLEFKRAIIPVLIDWCREVK